jgi:hypothetical protein
MTVIIIIITIIIVIIIITIIITIITIITIIIIIIITIITIITVIIITIIIIIGKKNDTKGIEKNSETKNDDDNNCLFQLSSYTIDVSNKLLLLLNNINLEKSYNTSNNNNINDKSRNDTDYDDKMVSLVISIARIWDSWGDSKVITYIRMFIFTYIRMFIYTYKLTLRYLDIHQNTSQIRAREMHFRRVLFTIKLLYKCFHFLCSLLMPYWTSLYVLRRTCRQELFI